jgi:RNA polymerase sigma-70 factor, ECF subfamily
MDGARHEAADRAEVVARASYGKLIAILAKRCGDIAAAEDALGDAFAAALAQWPRDGTPDNPPWLAFDGCSAQHRPRRRATTNGRDCH